MGGGVMIIADFFKLRVVSVRKKSGQRLCENSWLGIWLYLYLIYIRSEENFLANSYCSVTLKLQWASRTQWKTFTCTIIFKLSVSFLNLIWHDMFITLVCQIEFKNDTTFNLKNLLWRLYQMIFWQLTSLALCFGWKNNFKVA